MYATNNRTSGLVLVPQTAYRAPAQPATGRGLGLFDTGFDVKGWGLGEWLILSATLYAGLALFGPAARQREREIEQLRGEFEAELDRIRKKYPVGKILVKRSKSKRE